MEGGRGGEFLGKGNGFASGKDFLEEHGRRRGGLVHVPGNDFHSTQGRAEPEVAVGGAGARVQKAVSETCGGGQAVVGAISDGLQSGLPAIEHGIEFGARDAKQPQNRAEPEISLGIDLEDP